MESFSPCVSSFQRGTERVSRTFRKEELASCGLITCYLFSNCKRITVIFLQGLVMPRDDYRWDRRLEHTYQCEGVGTTREPRKGSGEVYHSQFLGGKKLLASLGRGKKVGGRSPGFGGVDSRTCKTPHRVNISASLRSSDAQSSELGSFLAGHTNVNYRLDPTSLTIMADGTAVWANGQVLFCGITPEGAFIGGAEGSSGGQAAQGCQ
jgi:hypothetical protein